MEGTNTIFIDIVRKTILDRIKSGAYYIGESVKGELLEVAAMLQASDDDDAILKDFFAEGNTELVNILQKYMGRTKVQDIGAASSYTAISSGAHKVGDIGTNSSNIYVCINGYTGTYNSDNWQQIAANSALFEITSVQNFNENNLTGLTNSMYDYLVDFALKEWTKPVPNTAKYYENKIAEDTQAIRELCCHREKPTRS